MGTPAPLSDPGAREPGVPQVDFDPEAPELPSDLTQDVWVIGKFNGYQTFLSASERCVYAEIDLAVQHVFGQPNMSGLKSGATWSPKAVVSYSYWKRRLGGDPKVLGHTIYLNTYPFEIVGVSPLGNRRDNYAAARPGREPIDVTGDAVSPGFFDTEGIRRISGHDFNTQDKLGAPLAAVINASLVRLLYPNEQPLGQTLNIHIGKQDQSYRIIGVVADTDYYDVHALPATRDRPAESTAASISVVEVWQRFAGNWATSHPA